jgi:predicted nucleotidyltransferase component of viral defense system
MDNFLRIKQYFDKNPVAFDQYLKKTLPWVYDYTKLEKDFYLTAILNQIALLNKWYVFKWGTCLNKCHFGYYRLSEDLDFSLIVGDANRTQRSVRIQEFFDDITTICSHLWLVCIDQRKRDTNHFGGMIRQYTSVITQTPQSIIFDIKTYNTLATDIVKLPIRDIYTDPLIGTDIFPKMMISCISLAEAMAEKMRAALTRTTPAIRDFYDIWYARQQGFDFTTIRELIAFKLAEVDNLITITSPEQYQTLLKQVDTDLRPVIFDLGWFDLTGEYEYVLSFQ